MIIPKIWPLLFVLLYVLVIGVTMTIQIYHIKKFSAGRTRQSLIVFIYLAVCFIIFVYLFEVALSTDWSQPLGQINFQPTFGLPRNILTPDFNQTPQP